MELQLNNIGMIKEANVKLDGLTVIAGENDTGKSTVGKALVAMLRSSEKDIISQIFQDIPILKESLMLLETESAIYRRYLSNSNADKANIEIFIKNSDIEKRVIFIESPLVWNFTDFFRDIAQIESQMDIKLDYPYLMKDLNFKLHIKSASDGLDIKKQMTDLMGGEFKKDEMGRYYFDKNGQKIDLVNTATGIKTFGIFQVLSQNNYLNKDTVLILDEPEVHLHPKWQLEMAKVIVELVKNEVRVLVNSHSPYMIEALQRYSKSAEVNSDFYLAEDGYIEKENDSNSETLAKIFEKLSEPFDVFEEMDSQRMENLLHG